MAGVVNRDEVIADYFDKRLSANAIHHMLKVDLGIEISERHVKRTLAKLNLSRRNYSNPTDVVAFIQGELRKSGQLNGYRIMYIKCLRAGLNVRMEDVRSLLRQLDPLGVDMRKSRRLLRRAYYSSGPNYIWHVDGNDKLKPYGLCIHGCICGYSRKIIWLNCYRTNNNPRIIGGYYLEAVRECGGCPVVVRGDYGTENGHIRDFQCFLRGDIYGEHNGIRPYMDGASTANQRIESWWGFLKKACTHFWMDHFQTLRNNGDFGGNDLDKNLVQFCFMALLQGELDAISEVWDMHTIRPSRNANVPHGKPGQMYNMPSIWGAEDCLCPVEQEDVENCSEEADIRSTIPCDPHIYEMCVTVMARDQRDPATNLAEATDLYLYLRQALAP